VSRSSRKAELGMLTIIYFKAFVSGVSTCRYDYVEFLLTHIGE